MHAPRPQHVDITINYLDAIPLITLAEAPGTSEPSLDLGPTTSLTKILYVPMRPNAGQPAAPRFGGDTTPNRATLLVPPVCDLCLNSSGGSYAVGLGFRDVLGATRIIPVCGRHEQSPPRWDLSDLADRTGCIVLWGDLTDSFVLEILAASDAARDVPEPPTPARRYAHELARGQTGAVFAAHLRVDHGGALWLPTWARLIAGGVPGTDVPIARLDDGSLLLELDGLMLTRQIKTLPSAPSDFVVPTTHTGTPTPPHGRTHWCERKSAPLPEGGLS